MSTLSTLNAGTVELVETAVKLRKCESDLVISRASEALSKDRIDFLEEHLRGWQDDVKMLYNKLQYYVFFGPSLYLILCEAVAGETNYYENE